MASNDFDELPCVKVRGVGSELTVQVVPNASRTACAGFHDGALRLRLAAPPIEGRANAALLAWLAESLGLPKRAVVLISGETSRRKRVQLDLPAGAVTTWLRKQIAADGARGQARQAGPPAASGAE